MTPEEIMRELARDDIFSKNAMAAARQQRDTMTPIFVGVVERLTARSIEDMDDADVLALIPIFHLLGEWQAPTAHAPLAMLLRRPTDILEYLLGDAVTENAFRVMAGTFDGDLEPLIAAIYDDSADEFARSSCMSALVLIAHLQPQYRDEIASSFRSFLSRSTDPCEVVLTGWVDSIADLGLEDMTDEVRMVFEAEQIPPSYCDFEFFLTDLRATLNAGGAPAGRRYSKGLIKDAIGELSRWHCYSDAFFAEQKRHKVSNNVRVTPWAESIMQAALKVGRNDPCPCGSGKKFKKCCLH